MTGMVVALFAFAQEPTQNEVEPYASPWIYATSPATIPFISPKTAHRQEFEANVVLGHQIALENGIQGKEWECLYELGMRESGWNEKATNKISGAYGIPQALPASKMSVLGDIHDPEVQIKWFISYVFERYETSCKALKFQIQNNWY